MWNWCLQPGGSVKSSRANHFVPFQLSPEICFCTPPKAFCKWCLTHAVTVTAALFPAFSVSHPGDGVQGTAELPVKHLVSYWMSLLMSTRKYHHSQVQSFLHHTAWRKCASFLARAEKAKLNTTVWLGCCQGWTSAVQLVIQPVKMSCEQPRALAWLGSCICFCTWMGNHSLSKGDGCRLHLCASCTLAAAHGPACWERKACFLLTWIFCAIFTEKNCSWITMRKVDESSPFPSTCLAAGTCLYASSCCQQVTSSVLVRQGQKAESCLGWFVCLKKLTSV